MKKINVCFMIPLPPPYGGIANWSLLLKNNLDKTGEVNYEIIDISPKTKSMKGLNLFSRIFIGIKRMAVIKKELKRTVSSNKVDLIHLTTSGKLALFRDYKIAKIAKKHNIPLVYHVRFGRVPQIKEKNNWEFRQFLKVARLSSCIIAIDNKTFECLRFLESNCLKIDLIPNPFDTTKLDFLKQKNEMINSKTILFVGWVLESKGIEDLILAWERVREVHSDYVLKICGPAKNYYLNKIKKNFNLENVVFTGELHNEEALEEISKCSIFVLPSHTEGFPNVVLEAMALRKPIVATNVGAIPEMLSDDCGVLVNYKSPIELANAISFLIENDQLRLSISTNAYEKLQSKYLISTIMERYKQAWEESLNVSLSAQ